MIRNNWIKK